MSPLVILSWSPLVFGSMATWPIQLHAVLESRTSGCSSLKDGGAL